MLFGDDTAKIRTFAIMTVENNEKVDSFINHFKHLGIWRTEVISRDGSTHTFMMYNVLLSEIVHLAQVHKQSSFFFGKK